MDNNVNPKIKSKQVDTVGFNGVIVDNLGNIFNIENGIIVLYIPVV